AVRRITRPPPFDLRLAVAAAHDVPAAFRTTPDGDVGFAVSVVIARYRNVRAQTPMLDGGLAIGASFDVPVTVRAPEDGHVYLTVSIVIRWHDHVVVGRILRAPGHALHL